MKNKIRKIFCGVLAALTAFGVVIAPCALAFADSDVGTITINYVDEGTSIDGGTYVRDKRYINGATFSAALVATEGNGRFEWIDEVESDNNFLFDTDDMYKNDKKEDVAKALVKIASRRLFCSTRITDNDGKCVFDNMQRGIYIVWESDKEGTAEKYTDATPFLIEVPNREEEPEDFNVTVYPKTTIITTKLISVTGKKSWKGEDKVEGKTDGTNVTIVRPDSITLRLYANGVEVAKTTTNAKKGWAFSFDEVNALDQYGNDVTFTIKEDTVKGYVFTQDKPVVGENAIIINVTNTRGEAAAKTGDESNMTLWLVLIALSTGILVAGVIEAVYNKKKQTK